MITDVAARSAVARDKPYKIHDQGGLYLLVHPNGSKYWTFKYRFGTNPATGKLKEKALALGVYPDVSLRAARDRRDEARKLLEKHIDPGLVRQQQKLARRAPHNGTFGAVADEWFARFRPTWTELHATRLGSRFDRWVRPWLGPRPVGEIKAFEVLAVIRRIDESGRLDTAHRAFNLVDSVFKYAVASGTAERNPCADLDMRRLLRPVRSAHHASLRKPEEVGQLLNEIDGYAGSYITKIALAFGAHVFVRPRELRHAEWQEINFDTAEWRIPAEKMKMRRPHLVPLSRQAIALLSDIQPLTGEGRYVFPSALRRPSGAARAASSERCMSENTILAALRRLGYEKGRMTGHGWRSIASSTLNEQGWNRDAIERQLAHAERDKTRAAYNYAEHLDLRRAMMQHWSDYLDDLRAVAASRTDSGMPRSAAKTVRGPRRERRTTRDLRPVRSTTG
ncbi:MAG: tyrosine-type recombinase/integrase [Gammaproteobacteria bacterium]